MFPMKTINPFIFTIFFVLASGCTDKAKEAEKAKQDADAKARADAAKKEMQTLPQTFKPRYNKKLDSTDQKAGTETPPADPPKTP